LTVPNATVNTLKNTYPTANISVKSENGTVKSDDTAIGTGDIISINGYTYTAIKKGDVNGDGIVKSTDYMRIKNYIMGTSSLTDAQKVAADVNRDGVVKSTDYMKIKNYIMGTSSITIN
jgi:hypothetical protein